MTPRIVSVGIKLRETNPGSLCIWNLTRDLGAMMEALAEFHPLSPRTLMIPRPSETGEIDVTVRMTQTDDRPLALGTLNEHLGACVNYIAKQHALTPLYAVIMTKCPQSQGEH